MRLSLLGLRSRRKSAAVSCPRRFCTVAPLSRQFNPLEQLYYYDLSRPSVSFIEMAALKPQEWRSFASAPSWAQPEDFWDTLKRWIISPFYKQIHKVELLSVIYEVKKRSGGSEIVATENVIHPDDLEDLNLWELERKAATDPDIVSAVLVVKRRLYPKDYTRKIEMESFCHLDILKHRVEFSPFWPEGKPDPVWLPHYHIKAQKFAIALELFHAPDYTIVTNQSTADNLGEMKETGTPLPKKEDDIPSEHARSSSPPRPTGRLSFDALMFDDQKYQEPDKLTRIGSLNLKTLEKWAKQYRKGGYTKRVNHDVVVPRELFTSHYRRLKEKYGFWVADWEETTDPQKFVFEDVGIAAFLIALWEIERDRLIKEHPDRYDANYKQSFVDLGAGNGFLVYLLVSEGFPGTGIDIQKRKIWAKYPENVKILEEPIRPESVRYEGVDWILANHSDELTPWIPLIASRTNSRFWVLPCCEWNFDKRFTGKRPNLSRYLTYLEYVKEIAAGSGYKVEVEPLRIPSTRNISIVGQIRTIDVNDPSAVASIEEKQQEMLKKAKFAAFEPRARDQDKHAKKCCAASKADAAEKNNAAEKQAGDEESEHCESAAESSVHEHDHEHSTDSEAFSGSTDVPHAKRVKML